jgi:hypothetical protein
MIHIMKHSRIILSALALLALAVAGYATAASRANQSAPASCTTDAGCCTECGGCCDN